jgi:hypothetical protein
MLKALKDTKHPEHMDFKDWLGGEDFDPTYFDKAEVNKRL